MRWGSVCRWGCWWCIAWRLGGHRAASVLASAFMHVVLVGEGAFEHIAHDLHVAVPVCAKAFARRHRVVVEHQQIAMPLVAQVKVVAKRKAVGAVQPAGGRPAPFGGGTDGDHGDLSFAHPVVTLREL